MKTPEPITDASGSMPGAAPGSENAYRKPVPETPFGNIAGKRMEYEYWEIHCRQYTKPHLVKLSRQHPGIKARPYRYEFALAMQLLYPGKCQGTTAQDITGMQQLPEDEAEAKFKASRCVLPIHLGEYTFYKKDGSGNG